MKEFTNGEVTITWDHKKCMHSEKCWRNLGEVFKPKDRPWIHPEGASSEVIVDQVKQCPSGALGYYYNDKEESDFLIPQTIKAQVMKNGPVLITGKMEITTADGKSTIYEKAALCWCGASINKPFCDGSHKKISFEG